MFEELESRLLMSADLNPLTNESLLAAPALQGAEFRALADDGSAVTRTAVSAVRATTEVVFVDSRVPDRAQLLGGLTAQSDGRRFEVIELDPRRDGIAQVTEALRGRIQIDAVHFITHGADGAVQLGGTWLDAKALAANADAVAGWGDSLKQDADILFYGCDLASGASGRALMGWIAELTRGDVAASDDATGAVAQGGDWVLEAAAGAVETRVAIAAEARAAWAYALGGVPTGGETRVNTITSSGQEAPAVATAPDGRGVIAWVSNNQDGDGRAIVARLFAPSGAPSTGEFVVNTTPTNDQLEPAVAMDQNGNFVVAWSGNGTGDTAGIFARRFDALGNPIGPEFRVNGGVSGAQSQPDVAMDLNGDFAVVWQSDDGGNLEIWLQRYSAGGTALGGANLVSMSGSADTSPSIAMDDDGDLVVTWEGQDGGGLGVYARRYDRTGAVLDASPVLVNSTTVNNQMRPDVAMDANGNFIVVWDGAGGGDTQGVYAQRYGNAPALTPVGGEFRVNTTTGDAQTGASVSMAGDGRTVVAWESFNQDGLGSMGVYRQEYLPSGAVDGGEQPVNTVTVGAQGDPTVAMDDGGGYWVAWSGNGPGDTDGVFERRFLAAAAGTISGTVFNDVNGNANVADDGAGAAFTTARVDLYRDSGLLGVIDGPEILVATTFTDGSGNYSFGGFGPDTYYVVVDSRSLGAANVWAEQTYGVAGSALGGGFTVLNGDLYGGRSAAVSDSYNGTALTTSEHVVQVALSGAGGAAGVDFGFSFNAITSNRDGDDAAEADRWVQGSLRQFIQNSNASIGVQEVANFSIGGGGAQTITISGLMPALTIVDPVVLDGGTQDGFAGTPLIELNGAAASTVPGLTLAGTGLSTVRALLINRFGAGGIVADAGSDGNSIVGNWIGIDSTGNQDLGNNGDGVRLSGDANAISGNVISGNAAAGVKIESSGSNNVVTGNYIGTNSAGTQLLLPGGIDGNSGAGVNVLGAANTIGGSASGDGNVIAGNLYGVWIDQTAALGNVVQGNLIGTDRTGTADLGNKLDGVRITAGARNNTIGGINALEGNLISGNNSDGVEISGLNTSGNFVQGNLIGTGAGGSGALWNNGAGVLISGDASNNTVGGLSGGNTIAHNLQDGVTVSGGGGGNAILGNAIHQNAQLGIDLVGGTQDIYGVTANDGPGDLDGGANRLQNSLQLYAAGVNGPNTIVHFGFSSAPSSTFRVQFFASGAQDPSGFGEGQRYVGDAIVGTDAAGFATSSAALGGVIAGEYITATVTSFATNDTSEFSNAVMAANRTIAGTIYDDVNADAVVSGAEGGFGGARVDLYLDDADGVMDAGDLLLGSTISGAGGAYTFTGLGGASYWVVVDSKSLGASGLWAEQTYAVGGAASGAGFTSIAGALYGGRERLGIGTSDGATTLGTAEHVIGRSVAGGDALAVDFGFSFSAVTNARDGDDDAGPRTVQGSLRQFILNSNALAFMQTSAFHIGAPGNPATINVTGTALPTITDAVILDAWSQGGAVYSGSPLIELNGAGAGGGANGLTITSGGSTVRGFVIRDFEGHGVSIAGGGGNTIASNYIGTDATGTGDRGNGLSGVHIDNSAGNMIGGASSAQGNVISGNALDGVSISGPGATGNFVRGNLIGLDVAGSAAIANGAAGVDIDAGASGNTVGAIGVNASNVISGNLHNGVEIDDAGTTGNVVVGNYIGLDAAGGTAIGNERSGIAVTGASGNSIGAATSGGGNVVSGNVWDGISLVSANGNLLQSNYVGTDWTGNAPVANREDGIYVLDGANNNIGGTGGAGNLLSGNLMNGLQIRGASTGNVVAGNFVGVNAAGSAPLANSLSGVVLDGASGNTIGGAGGAGNVLSGNLRDGLTAFAASNNRIEANLIGTDLNGAFAIANREDGVYLEDSSNNTIGGSTPGAGNLISGNRWSGVSLAGTGAGNRVQGNSIGTDAAGTGPLANAEAGVYLSITGPTTVGGTAADEGNLIAYNGWDGVAVMTGTGHSVLGNVIFGNAEQAIDIDDDGVTANDAGDGDAGTNELQNFPRLFGAAINGPAITISGMLDGASGTSYRIEFFADGVGGPRFLGALSPDLFIGAAGSATFVASLTASVTSGETITATATNLATGSTSELSAAVTATSGASISGTLFHDINGNAIITDDGAGAVFMNATNAVALYLDDGDNLIDSGDSFVAAVSTTAAGGYSFNGLAAGTYYVVVNSRALGSTDVWAEQTYAVAGAANGGSFMLLPGALYGGRDVALSDNALGSINTAEHVTRVTLAGGSIGGIDSGFSFNAIVNTRGDDADDDTSNARMQQGTLRQFILNANALTGTQVADFSINYVGGGGPQTINVTNAELPTISGAVVLDTTTQEGSAGVPIIELNGAGVPGANGLTLSSTGSIVRGFAINRFDAGIALLGGGGNTIAGNHLGTDLTGTIDRGNQYGLRADAANANTIEANVISGNSIDGLWIRNSSGNLIRGNYIGLDASGTFAIANDEDGIWLDGGSGNVVGGSAAGDRNVISGNGWSGVAASNLGADHVIQGNWIGLDASGAALGNAENGVRIYAGTGVTVGGSTAGAGNVIANNGTRGPGYAGVTVDSGSGHSILGNSFYANSGLGIDLGSDGLDANDAGDSDGGANDAINSPEIYGVTVSAGSVTVTGEARPGTTVQFFEAAPDPLGAGEGQMLLYEGVVGGATPGLVDPSARQFSFTFAAGPLALGDPLTATATDAAGNTSEFSANVSAAPPNSPPTASAIADQSINQDTSLAPVAFTIGDVETAAGSLVVTASASNPALVPNGNITLGGAGANRTVAVTPLAGQYGSATITISVSDGTDTTVTTFVLTVNPNNALPVVTPATFVVAENSANGTAVGSVAATDPDPADSFSKIYWTDVYTQRIYRANFDGTGAQVIVSGLSDPRGIAVDYYGGKIYWTDYGTNRIQRANLDGTSVQTIVSSGLSTPSHLKLDAAAGKMYWVDEGTGTIKRANLDGTGTQTLRSGLLTPKGLDLDLAAGRMYYVENGMDRISSANLDGSGATTVINLPLLSFPDPWSLSLDAAGGKMYWTDPTNNRISRANLDGSGLVSTFISATGVRDVMVDSSRGTLYWTDEGSDRIRRANLDGTGVTTVLGLDGTFGSADYYPSGIVHGPAVQGLTYTIVGGNPGSAFAIDALTGAITVANAPALDFEATPTFTLTVQAVDAGGMAGTGTVTINLANVNEAATGTVAITGPAVEDQTLTANTAGISDPDGLGPFAYQWERSTNGGASWSPIVGMTASTLALGDADVGTLVRVVATSTDGSGFLNTFTSTAVGPVANVNDAPVIVVAGGVITYTENDPATPVDSTLTVADIDNAALAGATVRITGGFAPGEDVLTFTAVGGITGVWNGVTGTLTLSGPALLADWQTALRSVSYQNTSEDPVAAARTVEFVVNDGVASATPVARTVNVLQANDAPVANSVNVNGTEDDPVIAITLTASDIDDAVASFRLAGLPANGLLYTDALLTTLAVAAGNYPASGNALTLYFVPATNWNGSTGFQFDARDATGADSALAAATIVVDPANDAPVANNVGAAGGEDDPSIAITLTASDIDDAIASFRLAGLPANGVLYANPGLTVVAMPGTDYAAAGNALTLYFVPAGNWSGSTGFQFTARDAGGLDSAAPATATITVAPVNDAPVVSNVTATGFEDDASIAITLTGLDVDDGVASFRIVGALPANGTLFTDAALTIVAATGVDMPASGSALTLYFAPAANWNGSTGFQFIATDTFGLASPGPADAVINVLAANDPPSTGDATASGNEDDASIAITLTGADTEGPVASFRIVGALPANGLLYVDAGLTTLAAAGTDYAAAGNALTLYFVPAANWSGTTGFQFAAVDGVGVADGTPATATINIAPVNDAPTASDVTANGAEDDASIAIALVGSDVDGAVASFRLVAVPANGVLYTDAALTSAAAAGVGYAAVGNALTLYFVPAADWNGATSFQYTATDGGGLSDATPATATINVAAVNDSPAAAGDFAATGQDTPVTTGDVLANDALGDLPSAIVAFDAASARGGTVIAGPGNTFVYTPAAAFSGTDTFTYTVRDADGEASTATVTVTVANLANDPPVNIVPGAQISAEDAALVFSSGGGNRIAVSDPDAGASPLEVTLAATNGTLTLAGVAGLTFTAGTGAGDVTMTFRGTIADINAALDGMSFLPPLNFTGNASVAIATGDLGASGPGGPLADSDTVDITVNPVDDAPTLDLDANDSSGATGADYARSFTENGGSRLVADADAFLADTDSANLASLVVTLTNPLDGAAETLSANTAGTLITASYNAGTGVLTLNGADTIANYQMVLRTVRYDNASEAPNTSAARVITFVASDGASASNVGTATVTINAVNDDPVATITAASYTATENVPLALHGTGMSVSDVDALPASIVEVHLDAVSGLLSASASNGTAIAGNGSPWLTLTGTLAQINAVLDGTAGTVTYNVGSDSPFPTDTLDLSINDRGATGSGGARWDWESVTVNLIAVNDAPIITIPGTATTAEDTALVFSAGSGNQISVTDVDAAGAQVAVALSVTNGALDLAGVAGLTFTAGANGTATMTVTGTVAAINTALDGLAFTPTANYSGSAFLSVSVNDQGASGSEVPPAPLSDADFVSITVTPSNDAPDGADATITTPVDTPYVLGDASFGFTDGDAGDTLAAVRIDALPAAGALTLSGGAVSAGQTVAVADIAAGNLVFTPALGGTGAPYASLAFSVQDSGGAFDASPNTLTVNVATPVNNPPSGTDGAVTTAVGTDFVFALADFGYVDPDAGDAFGALRIDTLPSPLVGTLYFGALALVPGVDEGTVVTAAGIAGGNLYFRPVPLLPGSASFEFSVRDTSGPAFDVVPNTMTVNVVVPTNNPVNVVPAAVAATEDTVTAIGGISVNDPNGDLASVQLVVASGTLSAVAAGTAVVAGAGTNVLTITGAQADINATLASFVYVGSANFAGADTLTITSTDATLLADTDSVPITVNPVNDAPIAAAPAAYAATEQVMLALTGLAVGDVDAGGNPVTVTLSAVTGAILVGGGPGVTVIGSGTPVVTLTGAVANINAVLAGGAVDYLVTTDSPPATDTLTLAIDDGGWIGAGGPLGASTTATITITAANDAPVNTLPGGATTLEDTAVVYSAAGGNQIAITDVDAGGAPVQVSLAGSNGVVTLGDTAGLTFGGGDGTADANMTFTGTVAAINAALDGLVFAPNPNYNGLAFITMTTNDLGASGAGGPLSDTDLATIDVLPVNDAPDGTDTTVALNEDTSYTFSAGDFGFNDVDFGDAMTEVRIDSISLPAGATLMLGATPVTPGLVIPTANIGLLVFTPVADANGAGFASFTFSVKDTGVPPGPLFDLAPNTMTIDVAPVNDLPVVTSHGGLAAVALAVVENTTGVTTVTAADIDGQPLVFSIAGGLDAARFAIDAVSGVLTFNPAPNFEAPADAGANNVYDVVVRVEDGAGGSDTQTFAITVTDTNDAPFVTGDAYVVVEDNALSIAAAAGTLANDGDEDGNPIAGALVAGPANGTVAFNADGSFVYTPNANFTGVDSFTYNVSDGAAVSADATVTISVTPVNDAPAAADGAVLSAPAVAYAFTLADFGFSDVDGDALDHVRITALPTLGALTVGGAAVALNQVVTAAEIAGGSLQYLAPSGTTAADTFGFLVHDGTVYAAAANAMTVGFILPPAPPAPPAPPPVDTSPPVAPPAPPAPAPEPGPTSEPGAGTEQVSSGGAHAGGGGGSAAPPTPTFTETAPAAVESAAATVAAAVAVSPTAVLGSGSGGVTASAGGLQTDPRAAGDIESLQARGQAIETEMKAVLPEVAAVREEEFQRELSKLREEVQQDAVVETRVAASVFAVSTGLSVGYVLWLLRGGVLIASLLSSIPAWRLVDPLPVLGRVGGQDDEDDESLEEMVERTGADEAAGGDDAPRGFARIAQAFRRSTT